MRHTTKTKLVALLLVAAAACQRDHETPSPPPQPSLPPHETLTSVTDLSSVVIRVERVIDGDTVVMRGGEHVRLIGIDTPERGECGFDEATERLSQLVSDTDGPTVLVPGARTDRDRYDRLLRYVDLPSGDAGLTLIQEGLAVARYDSRDGYGAHPRETTYVDADAASPNLCEAP